MNDHLHLTRYITTETQRQRDAQRAIVNLCASVVQWFCKGKRFTLLLIVITCFASFSNAQITDTFSLIKTYKGDITGAAMDNLDNLYLISSTGQVKKYGPKGDSIGVFNGIRNNGKLYSIDVTNPLKPLLFYKDFSSVVILDRFLANRSTIDFRKYNILQPSAIGLSYDNNIWVYDAYDNKLRKMDEAGNIQLETPDFRQLFGKSISPQKIINDNGLVYLADSAAGIFIFDNYGAFKKKIDLKGWNNFEVRNGMIVRLTNDAILVYNQTTFTEQRHFFPTRFKPYLHSFTKSNKLISFSQDSLHIYRMNY